MKKAYYVLILWFFSSLVLISAAEAFSDVREDYIYSEAINTLKDLKIVQGYGDDTYRPEAPVTRAELLKMMVESFPDSFSPHCDLNTLSFPDIGAGRWFSDYVCKGFKAGLVNGYPDGTFKPHKFINVAEVSKIVSRLKGTEVQEGEPWYENYVGNLEAWHYLLPTFVSPADLVNRGEMAELLTRMNQENRSRWFSAYDTNAQRFIPQSLGALSALPWKLNLETLPAMRLEGKDLTVGRTLFQNSRYKTQEINYTSNGLNISGLMNVPRGEGPFPVVVLAHGYYPKNLYQRGTGLKREQDYFVRAGFVTIHPDYRGYAESADNPENRGLYDGAMGYTMDVVNLVEAIKGSDLEYLQKEDFVIFGHSMGGATALNIAVTFPKLFEAVVLYAPSGGWAWDNYQRWWKDRAGSDWSVLQWKAPQENAWSWEHLSAKYLLANIEVPVYLFHGNKDGETSVGVPVSWSDELAILLREKGKRYEYFRFPEQGHVFVGEKWLEMMIKSVDFFEDILK